MDDPIDRNIKVVKIIGPSDKPYAKILQPEKRVNQEDRRKIHTYIADDKRSGIADRRKRKKKK